MVLEDPYHADGIFEKYTLSEWQMFGLNTVLIESR
jgi:hypothetical protein